MKTHLLVALIFFGAAFPAPSTGEAQPILVERMCGKLVSITRSPEKGTGNSSRQAVTPIAHARVRLFAPSLSADCCGSAPPLAQVQTRSDGSFEFKKMDPGDYRLIASINGKEYDLLIRYQPVKKSAKDCSELLYALEGNKFQLEKSVTVTVT